jgi:hypothetical protein
MPLYFAYGSNMDRAGMAARCPGSSVIGPARLARHRLIITREGYASVARDPRRAVWGVLWDLALADVPALDRYESVASRLYVKINQPVLTASGPKRALVYVARSAEPGRPRPGYLEGVIAAAQAAGLPADYVRDLAGWLPAAAAAARPRGPSPASSALGGRERG